MKTININEVVKVKLKPAGEQILKDWYKDTAHMLNEPVEETIKTLHKRDRQGYREFQLWQLMHIFGPHLVFGFDPPFETNMVLRDAAAN